MQKLDVFAAREIAMSDLAPGFKVLSKEKPAKYRFDESAFKMVRDAELLSVVEFYSDLVKKGMGWKASVALTYEKARKDSLDGCH